MTKCAFYAFEFGILKIGYTDTAITYLKRVDCFDAENVPSRLSDLVFKQIREYLDRKRKKFDFPYEFHGTDFQKKVWKALLDIPYGETRTYKDIAIVVGSPKGCRAVGMANNKNPLSIFAPCHRVIGASGKLVGYAGGLEMKEALLTLEKKNM